ncbi:hypothetical protein ACAF76_008200 [Brevibacillus sp. TJ4]|uniref:hypothetical protein n=1 Tax=Brevibacillus sp. TJ4 TaxID=3234853 RepID=UPI0037D2F898
MHHVNPLSQQGGLAREVNPITDFVPVCSNCHQIIHRKKDQVLGIEEIKIMIGKLRES